MTISDEEVVRRLYEALLERKASDGDVAHYVGMVAQGADGITTLVRVLANSSEFKNKARSRLSEPTLDKATRGGHLVYDSVISFGTHCATAKLLQKAELKRFSTPFDWIFSKAEMIIACLKDDFSAFLDPVHYMRSPNGAAQHLSYQTAYRIDDMFNHRDPSNPDNYTYYCQCVSRFREIAKAGRPFLGIMVTEYWKTSIDQCLVTIEAILNYAATVTMVILRIHQPDPNNYGCRLVRIVNRHRVIDFTPYGAIGPLDFVEPLDTVVLVSLMQTFATDARWVYEPE